jgi:hypothetical protein
MKTKKALAVVLAVVMLVMPLAVSSFAADNGIEAAPLKTAYNDTEFFNAQGLSIVYEGEIIEYTPADSNFRFEPASNELLTVDTTEVAVYYNNRFIGMIPVTVEHQLGELTVIDHGHGYFCLGCGTLHNFENHVVEEWIPNDDGGIFTLQTQTGVCTICNAEVTESIPGSEKFFYLFDTETEGALTELETTVLMYFYNIAVSLIQMLTGIS